LSGGHVEAIRALTDVLVTGASGFAGSHLIDLLQQSGASITGWRHSSHRSPGKNPSVQWQAVELLDADAVRRAIADVRPSRVFHCAGAAHVGHSWDDARETLATNVLGTHHLLSGLRAAGIRARVLIPGSSYVYRQSEHPLKESDPIGPTNPYALSKLAQEMLGARGSGDDGQEVFVTRSFNHIGARQDPSFAAPGFARQIALIEAGRMPPTIQVGNLDARRDLTDVRDTVRAYRDIIERGRPGTLYNVCSGKAYTIRSLLDRLIALSRVPVGVEVDPARCRPHDTPLLLGDRTRLTEDTGWEPAIELDQSLSDLLEYWRKEIE
jgi:GDP-4-dehydro-6-deoxy-D-mannose reductase